MIRPASIAALCGEKPASPSAMVSAFTKGTRPPQASSNRLADVLLPAPFGPASMMNRGLFSDVFTTAFYSSGTVTHF